MNEEKFKNKINKILDEFNSNTKYVSVYIEYGRGIEIFTIKDFLLNWSSIGSVGIETTDLFITNLKKAKKLAKKLKIMLSKQNKNGNNNKNTGN